MLYPEEIDRIFLDKLNGIIVKIGEGEDSKKYYVCSACQKEYRENLKEKISKL
ncbi:MAG: hypothetical protein ABIH79_00720 [archaeon]